MAVIGKNSQMDSLSLGHYATISSWSYSGTTITVNTATPHNFVAGDIIQIIGLISDTNTPYGEYVVTGIIDADTFTFTHTLIPTGTPTLSLYARVGIGKVKSSGIVEADIEFKGKNACTAWVNFDGTTTPPTIRDSYNVKAVIRTATGVYDVYFEKPMDNVNYTLVGTSSSNLIVDISAISVQTISKATIRGQTASGILSSSSTFTINVFGGRN